MLHEFVYLFLIDLVRIPLKHDYTMYAKKEPGYGSCMLRAYLTAFNKQTDGLMSEELIHAIHKEAMHFLPNCNPGQYKNDHNNVCIYPYVMDVYLQNQAYHATSEGINEFITYWFKNTANPFHSFCTTNVDNSNANLNLFMPNPGGMTLYSTDSECNRNKPQIISFEQAEKKINALLSLSKNRVEINHFADEAKEDIQKLTSERMQIIIKEFNAEITVAQNADEKIKIIAKHIQRIDQLHPYSDGNIRTCYILMNKLLKDHGLSLTLLMNPNRLDACSIEQIVQMIKQGQMHYRQVVQHIAGNIQLSAENEMHKATQSFTCFPRNLEDISKSLIEDFIACVIEGKPKQMHTLKNNAYSFLSAPKKEPIEKLMDELSLLIDCKDKKHNPLITALDEKKFNLALRQICANYDADVIETILKFHEIVSFDPLDKSSSGKTALDWLNGNTHLEQNKKESIKNTLLSFIKQDNLEFKDNAQTTPHHS